MSWEFETSNWISRALRIRRPFLPRIHVPNFRRHQHQFPQCSLALPTLRPNRSSAAADELGVRFDGNLGPRIGFAEHLEFDVSFLPRNHVPNFMRRQQQVPHCILAPPIPRPNRSSAAADELGLRFPVNLRPRIGFAENFAFEVSFCPETTCREAYQEAIPITVWCFSLIF